jgi:hypothetical protein
MISFVSRQNHFNTNESWLHITHNYSPTRRTVAADTRSLVVGGYTTLRSSSLRKSLQQETYCDTFGLFACLFRVDS